MRPAGRRRRASVKRKKPNPPSTSQDVYHQKFAGSSARDSDASFASTRSSSVGGGSCPINLDLYKKSSFRKSAVATINSYLSSLSFLISFKSTPPSTKDIHQTLKFLMARLDFPKSDLADDLPNLLKLLNCPFKINKYFLRAPASPHRWPTFVAIIHWLVEFAGYNDCLDSSANLKSLIDNDFLCSYILNTYLYFIKGDDAGIGELDQRFWEKLERGQRFAEEKLKATEENVARLEAELVGLRSNPSQKEVLEEKSLLEDDVKKLCSICEKWNSKIKEKEKVLGEKEKQLDAKVQANKTYCEENEELKKRVELQIFNVQDVERIKKELQIMERDIREAELARNAWEEMSCDPDTTLGLKFKELEALALNCNEALKRFKIGNGFQYQLNTKGSTLAEIMGIDYKLTLKPALNSYADGIKKTTMGKLEELISLQEEYRENDAMPEGKRNHIAATQSHIDHMEVHVSILRKEIHDCTSRCDAEAKKMLEEVQLEAHNLDIVEREAAEILKASKLKLQEASKRGEEEIQKCTCEFFMLVDSISKNKEHVESEISEMMRLLSETAVAVSDSYKSSGKRDS